MYKSHFGTPPLASVKEVIKPFRDTSSSNEIQKEDWVNQNSIDEREPAFAFAF